MRLMVRRISTGQEGFFAQEMGISRLIDGNFRIVYIRLYVLFVKSKAFSAFRNVRSAQRTAAELFVDVNLAFVTVFHFSVVFRPPFGEGFSFSEMR